MEEGAKRRLVGAAVVVVLLVIFLPMLLEEETSVPISEGEMNIPPRPDFDPDRSAATSRPIESTVSGFPGADEEVFSEADPDPGTARESPSPVFFDIPVTSEPELDPEAEFQEAPGLVEEPAAGPPAETLSKATPAAGKVAVAPAPPAGPTPPKPKADQPPAPKQAAQPPARGSGSEEKPAPRKEAPQQVAKATPQPVPAKTTPKPPASASKGSQKGEFSWVIQVASLKDHQRAYSLVQELRAKGFPAYIQEAEVDRQLWHRVRVGPEIERSQIESMAASLKAKTGMPVEIHRFR